MKKKLIISAILAAVLLAGCAQSTAANSPQTASSETNAAALMNETAEGTQDTPNAETDTVAAAENSQDEDGTLRIAKQGMFSAGGTVTDPVPGEYDETKNWQDSTRAGNTMHVDHANVFYQIPENDNGNPIVFLHGAGQSRMGWMTTPDGREGWSDIFLKAGHSIFLVDQPRRGEAGQTAEGPVDTLAGDQAWYTHFRIGRITPERYENSQFPEGDEAQDPADVQPEEGEGQEPAFEQHEDTENQDPAEENSEEPADGEQPAEEAPAEEAGIAGTEEQAATDAEDQEDPEEAIADGKSEEPAAEEKKEEPSVEEKKEEPAAEEPVVADGEQPSSGAKETVPDVLLEQGDEETAADDAAGASQGTPLAITSQPEDAEAPVGQTVSFHVGANRTDASYQWQFSTNGTTWKICTSTGSNTDTFSFLMKDTLDGRKYRCAVTADGTTIISGEATVRLPQQQGDLTITQQPQDVEAAVGETVSLHVATNMADASFQWQFSTNGTTWKACTSAGSNTDTFSFLMKDTLDGRKYRCAVTGGGKTILSDEATVRLPQQQDDLTITEQPQDV